MSRIVPFDKGQPPRRTPPRTITQEELLDERILREKARDARRKWRRHGRDIIDRLVAGAKVEPGPFAAELDVKIR